jgi:hypothetical protein
MLASGIKGMLVQLGKVLMFARYDFARSVAALGVANCPSFEYGSLTISKKFVESMDLSNTFVHLGVGISAGTRPNAAEIQPF